MHWGHAWSWLEFFVLLEAEWLPQFGGRKPKSTPTIIIPQDVKRTEVPVDLALAINARFSELIK